MKKPAVFLDRDGTINIEKNYLHKIEDWEWIPGAIDAIRMLNEMGFLVVVVTNQAGVARGYYSEHDIKKLHDFISEELKKNYALIDAYYYCPHHPDYTKDDVCDCRKPKAGMLEKAIGDLDIDKNLSYIIGDKVTDIEAGNNIGIKAILVSTGYGKDECKNVMHAYSKQLDLLQAVKFIRHELGYD